MLAIIEKAVVLTAAVVLYGTINTWKKKHKEGDEDDSRTED